MLYAGVALLRCDAELGDFWLVLLIPLTFIATLAMGVILAALTVFYRDFKHVVPFMIQIMMYVTPVIYPANMSAPRWQSPVSESDVRHRHRLSLGDPGPGLELPYLWPSPRHRPSDYSCSPSSIFARSNATLLTSPNR